MSDLYEFSRRCNFTAATEVIEFRSANRAQVLGFTFTRQLSGQHVGSSAITNVQANGIADVRINEKSTNYGEIINEAKTLLHFSVNE